MEEKSQNNRTGGGGDGDEDNNDDDGRGGGGGAATITALALADAGGLARDGVHLPAGGGGDGDEDNNDDADVDRLANLFSNLDTRGRPPRYAILKAHGHLLDSILLSDPDKQLIKEYLDVIVVDDPGQRAYTCFGHQQLFTSVINLIAGGRGQRTLNTLWDNGGRGEEARTEVEGQMRAMATFMDMSEGTSTKFRLYEPIHPWFFDLDGPWDGRRGYNLYIGEVREGGGFWRLGNLSEEIARTANGTGAIMRLLDFAHLAKRYNIKLKMIVLSCQTRTHRAICVDLANNIVANQAADAAAAVSLLPPPAKRQKLRSRGGAGFRPDFSNWSRRSRETAAPMFNVDKSPTENELRKEEDRKIRMAKTLKKRTLLRKKYTKRRKWRQRRRGGRKKKTRKKRRKRTHKKRRKKRRKKRTYKNFITP